MGPLMWRASTDWSVGSSGAGLPPKVRSGGGRSADVLREAKILVVEDEMIVAALLEDRLLSLGCDVVGPAPRIDEALELLKVHPVDAAVLDVNIDGQPVFPVADELARRNIPFLFATAYGKAGVAERHQRQAILEKPYQERSLEHALRAALLTRGRH